MALTLGLLVFQRRVIRRTGSTAISADELHYRSDLLVNAGVIAALWMSREGWPGFDPLIAALIGLYILIRSQFTARPFQVGPRNS